jgi:hypothetical protein
MKKLVLFIHGLGGDADGTWQKFPELMRTDTKLTELYDVKTFEYSTGAFGSKPSLASVRCGRFRAVLDDRQRLIASDLKTRLQRPAPSEVIAVEHAQRHHGLVEC